MSRESMHEHTLLLANIVKRPTVLDGIHQSVFRNDAILLLAKWLLSMDTPPEVVLTLINAAECLPDKSDERTVGAGE